MHRILVMTISAAVLAGCSSLGIRSGNEQPAYEVVERIGELVEIRRYDRRLAVEAVMKPGESNDRRAAFKLLFDYISGENNPASQDLASLPQASSGSPQKIAMTAPVQSSRLPSGSYAMRFFLPRSLTIATAPRPLDPQVKLIELPPETMAALSFSGARDRQIIENRQDVLLEKLADTKWRPTGPAVAYLYDPPWTLPFLRLNEVAIPVRADPTR
jgi:hypothetical protein